jgi:hypothetical protein
MTWRHLALGMAGVWLVGMGRWWDDPAANFAQHLGLGSVLYVPLLAAAIWMVLAPLQPKPWLYREILTLVSLTSFPGILYALPVEKFLPPETADAVNLSFLTLVAAWRMGIVVLFLRRRTELSWPKMLVGTAMPILAVATALAFVRKINGFLAMMGGLRGDGRLHLADFTWWLWGATMVLMLFYLALIARRPPAPQSPSTSEMV